MTIKPGTFGCVEAGGTKFVCALADADGRWLIRTRIETEHPVETIRRVVDFLHRSQQQHGTIASLGVASFGPIELDRSAPNWGSLLETPKPHWSGASLTDPLNAAFAVPIGLETDVNAAALAEAEAIGKSVGRGLIYLTVGTGVGGGFVIDGQTLNGVRHPEMGHVIPPRHPLDTDYPGCCPYHGTCVEGLASGPAILARWGRSLSDLPENHPAQEIVSWYLGHLVATSLAILSPARIVFGGGVMDTPGLLARIRLAADRFAGGYLAKTGSLETIIAAPTSDDAGLRGALLIARRALRTETERI